VLKGNHGEVTEAVRYWVDVLKGQAPPDYITSEKRHGRLELREYWWAEAAELEPYVAETYGWRGLKLCGKVRRRHRRLHQADWESDETSCWVYLSLRDPPDGAQCCSWLRQHWGIENRVFWVLDVTYGEDRNHARRIGLPLTKIRHTAINILRHLQFRYIPDGQRTAAARPDRGLEWLLQV
jgi:hypothetical protein